MADIQDIERRYKKKRDQIESLFVTADSEFAKGINAIAEKQALTIGQANEEATKTSEMAVKVVRSGAAIIDQRACDELLIGYESLERQED